MITTKGAARCHSPNGFPASTRQGVFGSAPTAINPNAYPQGTKRLASCREELERSWGTSTTSRDFLHSVSSESEDDYGAARVKRRRTAAAPSSLSVSPSSINSMDCSMSFVRGNRISPTNHPQYPVNGSRILSQVKAGWHEGEIDVNGNRHGKGLTKHDDGTEYSGPYVNDIMEGPNGCYKFVTTRHLVPNPIKNGTHLHRQIEKSYVGNFKDDKPHKAGMIVTKTVDCAPQVLGSTPLDVRFMEVVYDFGMHRSDKDGQAVGEGIRVIYSATKQDGRSTLEETCYRLSGGESTNMKVAHEYAAWILQCLGMEFPKPPASTQDLLPQPGPSWGMTE